MNSTSALSSSDPHSVFAGSVTFPTFSSTDWKSAFLETPSHLCLVGFLPGVSPLGSGGSLLAKLLITVYLHPMVQTKRKLLNIYSYKFLFTLKLHSILLLANVNAH